MSDGRGWRIARCAGWSAALLSMGLAVGPGIPAAEVQDELTGRAPDMDHQVYYRLPGDPDPEETLNRLRMLAGGAELNLTSLEPGTTVERADGAYLPVHVVGEGEYGSVVAFVRYLGIQSRLTSVERLGVEWAGEDRVRLDARINVYHWSPLARRGPLIERAMLAAADRRSRRERELTEVLGSFEGTPVAFTEVSLGDELRLRGARALPAPDLRAQLAAAGVAVEGLEVARDGGCESFDLRGRNLSTEVDPESYPDFGWMLAPVGELCTVDRDPGELRVVGDDRELGEGPLTLRLRDADLADVFFALAGATGRGFLVGGDVRGRVSVELLGSEAESALTQLAGETGLQLGPAGPTRWVSRSPLEMPPVAAGSEIVSFDLKRTGVREALGVYQALAGVAVLTPAGDLGRVTIVGPDVPAEEAFAGTLALAGLRQVRVGGTILVAPAADFAEPPEELMQRLVPVSTTASAGSGLPFRDFALDSYWRRVTPGDLELIGVASAGDGWVAGLRTAKGRVHWAKAGDAVIGATLAAIDRDGIWWQPDGGGERRRVPLPPLR